MSEYTQQLAALGARVMGLWGFDGKTETDDLTQAVGEAIITEGLDNEDLHQVRAICADYDLDTREFGDTVPKLIAADDRPALELGGLQYRYDMLLDARDADRNDDEIEAAHNLIDLLLPLAGIAFAPTQDADQ